MITRQDMIDENNDARTRQDTEAQRLAELRQNLMQEAYDTSCIPTEGDIARRLGWVNRSHP